MIELKDFQLAASAQITDRFIEFMRDRPMRGTLSDPKPLPYYQALSSVTASGKTVILADALSRINASMAIKPVVIWLSKGRVVVSQTYANLQDGGQYRHLISDLNVHLLSEYDATEVMRNEKGQIFFATVGTFNQKDKELGERLIYQSDIDTAESSIWNALKNRENDENIRRPLIVIYDEGHNLSDQQTELLMELEPDAFLLASATMRLTAEIAKIIDYLEAAGWEKDRLKTIVPSSAVASSGLIKSSLILGGYAAPMEKTIDDMLSEMQKAELASQKNNTNFLPKAIYVSKTNIIEGNSFKKDDPKRPFTHREAPPIVIWRYLVEDKNIDPSEIAVYCSLDFDKNYPAPKDFHLFKGGDKDYENFIQGGYRHIIFNQSLQEGWDDPACYFAYIDKSMGSNIQVEQVIGRVLRQPGAKHYKDDALNTANFYVRVDAKNVFSTIVSEVQDKLSASTPEINFSTYEASEKTTPTALYPSLNMSVPSVFLDASHALPPITELVDHMTDYRDDSGVNIIGEGARAIVQQRIGVDSDLKWKWVPYEQSSKVSARWVFQLAVMKRYPKVLEVTPSDDAKFDAKIEFGSRAYSHIEELAEKVVNTYLENVFLKTSNFNPYLVSDVNVIPEKMIKFENALHEGYSGLNKLELMFANALDETGIIWARNPSRSGFGIPLLSMGTTKTFYPDFLAWSGDDIFAIDTTGGHLLLEKTGRKLLHIEQSDKQEQKINLRLISPGRWDDSVQEIDKNGFTVWSLKNSQSLRATYCTDIRQAVATCLTAPVLV